METLNQYFNILSSTDLIMASVTIVLVMSLVTLKRQRRQ